ncbi:MAG: hypothetical protein GXO65_01505 [Euryarchaeota archaeon]|nr:hypothetical protein [Euryarchaeota archaeon]
MGRRRRFNPNKRRQRHHRHGGGGGPKTRKLHMGRAESFEYYLKKALEDVEAGGIIFGNLYSKATNLGVDEAQEYLDRLVEDGNMDKDKARAVSDLMKRFSKFR